MALIKGWVQKHGDKGPPRSAAGFEWPGARHVTDGQRLAFQKVFTNALRARGENHRQFARVFFGETKDDKGYTIPRNGTAILEYADGGAWPTEDRARQLAAFLKVPLEALLVDDGKPHEPLGLVRPSRATAKRRKANGHGGNGHAGAAARIASPGAPALAASEPAPLRPRPNDAKPAQLHVDTYPDAPDYCRITISGTVRYDTAMAMVNLMGRDQHGHGPRK